MNKRRRNAIGTTLLGVLAAGYLAIKQPGPIKEAVVAHALDPSHTTNDLDGIILGNPGSCSFVATRAAKIRHGLEYARADAWNLNQYNTVVFRGAAGRGLTNTLARTNYNIHFVELAQARGALHPGHLVGMHYAHSTYQEHATTQAGPNAYTHVGWIDGFDGQTPLLAEAFGAGLRVTPLDEAGIQTLSRSGITFIEVLGTPTEQTAQYQQR